MKNVLQKILLSILSVLCMLSVAGCGSSDYYTLTETTFFRVMTNMLYFPEQYLRATIELDVFIYEITDVSTGTEYVCGVRKCSSGYGCQCGNDTIIGFILEYDGDLPDAKNQSEDTGDKSWVHLKGSLIDAEKNYIGVYAYDADGNPTDTIEQIYMYRFKVVEWSSVDGSDLAYYVTK